MEKVDIRRTFTLGKEDDDDIKNIADTLCEGVLSRALRAMLAERRLLLAKQALLGKRPTEKERAKWDGAGGG